MFKRNLVILVGIMALLLAGGSQALAGKKIINGIDANFPPFAFIDQKGVPSGFDWEGIITSLLTKKIDMVASGMSITPDRKEKVSFTNPYWVIKQVMVVKKDSTLTLDDLLKGKKMVGVQQGTSEAKWLKEAAEKNGWNLELRYYESSPLAVEDILNGRIAAAAMDDAPAKDAADKKDVKILGTFGMEPEDFGYAVRKEDTQLLKDINEGLKRLMASDHWKELIKKYDLK